MQVSTDLLQELNLDLGWKDLQDPVTYGTILTCAPAIESEQRWEDNMRRNQFWDVDETLGEILQRASE